MPSRKKFSLELRIEKLINVLERVVSRGAFSNGPIDADRPLDTVEAAAYLGLAPGTLSVWRCTPGKGPVFSLCGTRPRYTRASLEAWKATCTTRKRVSPNVGRPPGRGKSRRRS